MSEAPKPEVLLEYIGSGNGYRLWGCLGTSPNCMNRVHVKKWHCAKCILARDDETVGGFKERLGIPTHDAH